MQVPVENIAPLEALECTVLGSFREGYGNWRFYFPDLELTVWGRIPLVWNGAAFEPDDPFIYSVLRKFTGCELSHAELLDSAVVLNFYGNTLTLSCDADGEMVSLLHDGESEADVWTLESGVLTHTKGPREPFDFFLS